MNRLLRLALLTLLATTLGACTSYDSKWKTAAAQRPANKYSGRWVGEWKSTRGSHRGELQCVFTPAKAGTYNADFYAHWGKVAGEFSVPFQVIPVQGGLRFNGTKNLGPLQGGDYKYEGLVTPHRFSAHYESSADAGVFELHRP